MLPILRSPTDAMLHNLTSPDDKHVDAPQEEDVEQYEQRRRCRHSDEPPPEPAHHDDGQEHHACAPRNQTTSKFAHNQTRGGGGAKGSKRHEPATGSMARREREGKRRGTMATASCERSVRPQEASPDHSTSHGDRRSRWSPDADASLLIAAASSPSGSEVPSRPRPPPTQHGDPAGAGRRGSPD